MKRDHVRTIWRTAWLDCTLDILYLLLSIHVTFRTSSGVEGGRYLLIHWMPTKLLTHISRDASFECPRDRTTEKALATLGVLAFQMGERLNVGYRFMSNSHFRLKRGPSSFAHGSYCH